MKKLTITIAIVAIILLSFIGCDKYHRDRYIGNWEFVTEKCIYKYEYNGDSSVLVVLKKDTVYYLGVISCGNLERELTIQYTQNDEVEAYIDQTGGIYLPAFPCAGCNCKRGNFDKENKMNLDFGWDSQNSSEAHHIVGIKKKGDKNE